MDAFDAAAATYDVDFTDSAVGRAQREQVWRALAPLLAGPSLRVLELNCGTGADAVHMAQAGHTVLATDRSPAMIAATRVHVQRAGLAQRVRTAPLDLTAPALPEAEGPFDLVLSDLGGLNCIDVDDLGRVGRFVASVLRPGGRFVAVLMADRCLLETTYFLLRARPSSAFRRWTRKAINVPVGGGTVPTWYHPPSTLRQVFGPSFILEDLRPIGLFVPPGYLEPLVRHRPRLLHLLGRMDRYFSRASGLARLGDHVLIQFRRSA
ncbi:MAG: methyltransferase domain-containing protein [Flavobacteriales bacterium]|jgi:SAM-dependent methyltransferase|nr:methyltransferase domain-containing protein [Flavobacteriales bacterium]MBK7940814.1 methyltransferase domain-containing protein [Flavobacteriales bacterium]MBK8948542.1 methyltransferase domain-containing protein [Flavobacteriales bacterium]MBK9700767.1 methyltransferase domain-containing protein [Flavobacteriales bacterium]